MPQTFEDLMLVECVQTPLREQLLQPLSVSLKVESKSCFKAKSVESDVEPNDEPVLELHPSYRLMLRYMWSQSR